MRVQASRSEIRVLQLLKTILTGMKGMNRIHLIDSIPFAVSPASL
jgi:hypothetical protein